MFGKLPENFSRNMNRGKKRIANEKTSSATFLLTEKNNTKIAK